MNELSRCKPLIKVNGGNSVLIGLEEYPKKNKKKIANGPVARLYHVEKKEGGFGPHLALPQFSPEFFCVCPSLR